MKSAGKSRWKQAIVNSSILTILQILTILLRFANQTVFIRVLGKQFLGLNGLFTNLLTYLAFAELGIGTSIVFSLYKPLYDGNREKVSALMNFIKKAYIGIGIVILVLGLLIIPLFPYIIKDYGVISHIPLYFVLYLSNSVVSYFFTYKRSILIADQKEYRSSLNTFKYTVIQTTIQILILFLYKAYALYLIVATICTLFSNISISRLVDKQYPFLKKNSKITLGKMDIRIIKSNIVGMIGSRIGSIVVRSTDNLLLSAFLGLTIVGMYSNYLLIVTSVSAILSKLVSSVTASIGNLIAEKNTAKSLFVFRTHFYINFILTSITATILLVSVNPFVYAWAGPNYVLAESTVVVITVNYFIDQLRQTSIVFISAYGLFVPNGKKSIVEAVTNLIFSLLLLVVFHLGIKGVLLGTIITNLAVNTWFEPFLVFSKGLILDKGFGRFYLVDYSVNVLTMILIIGSTAYGVHLVDSLLKMPPLIVAIVNALLSLIVVGTITFLLYRNQDTFRYVINNVRSKVINKR